MKAVLVSFAVGLVLSIPTVAVLACDPNCAPTVVVDEEKSFVDDFIEDGVKTEIITGNLANLEPVTQSSECYRRGFPG